MTALDFPANPAVGDSYGPLGGGGPRYTWNGVAWTAEGVSGIIMVPDGNQPNPAPIVGWAQIYVDIADGDLKVIFGDGVIKTIAVDT